MKLLLLLVAYGAALSLALWRRGLRAKFAAARGAPGTAPAPDAAPARLLVVGATGGTGSELVKQALERGHEVTVFVRDHAALRIEHARLRVARGDVLDYASVEAAVPGHDAVLCALGHRRYYPPTRILSQGTQNLLRAMA